MQALIDKLNQAIAYKEVVEALKEIRSTGIKLRVKLNVSKEKLLAEKVRVVKLLKKQAKQAIKPAIAMVREYLQALTEAKMVNEVGIKSAIALNQKLLKYI